MTEPSQYFKGRTVQEQMNEVIGYVDARAEEVAAAKADDVLEPAEQAKDDAIAAKEAAEDARDTTLAALPQIQQDITDLKAEDVALDGRLDNVELRITTAEGNIVTIQGQITALQTADGQNVKLAGAQTIAGVKTFSSSPEIPTVPLNVFDGKAVNGTKLQDEILNNPTIVRTANNQVIAGVKTFTSSIVQSGVGNNGVLSNPPGIVQDATGSNEQVQYLRTTCPDSNGMTKELMFLQLLDSSDGTRTLRLNLYSSTGVRGIKNLATIQPDGTIS